MRALVCHAPGETAVADVPDPVPGPGQVLVAVEAAGVNYADALMVAGRYQIRLPPPFVPGGEVAGTVVAHGPDVSGPPLGTRVVALCGLGGCAERVAVSAEAALPLPAELDPARAATFVQSYCTALYALRDRAALREGETVLVLGAGGGVGLATVDLATALGATVLAGASTAEKRALATAAGAAEVVDTLGEDVKTAARAFSDGGVDVVLDPVGGALADPALRALRTDGRYLVIGFASGTIPALPLNQVLLRNRRVVGVDWGAWMLGHPAAQNALLADLLALAARGAIRPVAPATLPLADGARALEAALTRKVLGRQALVP